MHLAGSDHIVEELRLKGRTLSFKISPISFFQPNTLSAEKLYDTALSMLPPSALVYDLYCGTGTLGMAAANRARQVIGIELSPEAVIDAQENLLRNHIANVTIHQGDVGKVITRLMAEPGFIRPDAVIVDPPRAGLDPLALHHLKTLRPQTIVYVSCNPATQADNVRELVQAGYQLKRLQPLDQFPHTYHIENIALLQLEG
jgi:23S rRNA (uracil1939-C5)-methyltransferase